MDVFFWAIDPRVAFWTRFEANFRLGRNQGPLFLNGLASPRVPGQLRTLKTELVHHRDYLTRDEARRDIFEYIEVFYNRQRSHSTLGYLSPAQFEVTVLAA